MKENELTIGILGTTTWIVRVLCVGVVDTVGGTWGRIELLDCRVVDDICGESASDV